MNRLHPVLVKAVVTALQTIFTEGRYADKVIEQTLKSNPKWGSRDRAFIAESVYDIVRYYRLLYEIAGATPQSIADWYQLFAIYRLLKEQELPVWVEFEGVKKSRVADKNATLQAIRAVRESVPDWLDATGAAELGDQWEATLHALNQPAQVVLRANALKTSREALAKQLTAQGVETTPHGNGAALLVQKRQNLFTAPAFQQGLFEVQDASSQLVAPFLEVEPGMRVVDACAGGGGKTLHLAALMQNKGRIVALDTEAWKLEALRKRATRSGASIIETRPIENNKVIKRLYGSADRLLLDVPCSGLGVLRRNPDAKWKLDAAFLDRVRQAQAQILQQYSAICKPGGKLVYATCSILPSENEAQVARFVAANPAFRLLRQQSILPQDQGFDGFFMALLERQA